MRSTKKSLIMSTISLILCFAMLLGSTYAWFTDEVTSGVNQIKAGNFDVELYHAVGAVTADEVNKVGANTLLFNNITKWEPGMVAYENFMVKNVGNLALKYQLAMTVGDFNTVDGHSLKEVLKVAVVPGGFNGDRTAAQALTGYTTLENFSTSSNGALLPATEGDTFGVVIYWQPGNNDNLYNLNNGKTATVVANKFAATELGIELGVKLTAQQLPHEEDSFDKFYDKTASAIKANWSGESEEKALDSTNGAKLEVKVDGEVYATADVAPETKVKVTSDSLAEALTENEMLKLSITPDNTPTSITVETAQSVTTYDVSLIKVVTSTEAGSEGTKTDVKVMEADKPVLVSLDIGVVDLQRFYHHGTELTKVNDQGSVDTDKYYYNQTTGMIYFKTTSFSPFASVYKFAGGLGTADHPYLIANRNHMQGITNEYDTYNYYKVADGVETMDCSNWQSILLNGSFDGNNVKFGSIDAKLFRYVGKMGDGTTEGLATWDTTDVCLKDFEANFNMDAVLDVASGMIYQINGNNETTLENITISGKIAGGSNSGAFFTYTGPNLNDKIVTGMQQKVTLKNCKVTATLINTSGYFGVIAGYPKYCNPNIEITVNNPNTIWQGTAYTSNGKVAGTAWNDNIGFTERTCNKLESATINKDTTNKQYTCTVASSAAKMEVFISAQLTETDDNGNKTALNGITMSLGKVGSFDVSTESSPVKVLDTFDTVNFQNKQSDYMGSVSNNTLNAATAGTANYTIGSIKLAVVQYDSNGTLIASAYKVIAKKDAANTEWAIQ